MCQLEIVSLVEDGRVLLGNGLDREKQVRHRPRLVSCPVDGRYRVCGSGRDRP